MPTLLATNWLWAGDENWEKDLIDIEMAGNVGRVEVDCIAWSRSCVCYMIFDLLCSCLCLISCKFNWWLAVLYTHIAKRKHVVDHLRHLPDKAAVNHISVNTIIRERSKLSRNKSLKRLRLDSNRFNAAALIIGTSVCMPPCLDQMINYTSTINERDIPRV